MTGCGRATRGERRLAETDWVRDIDAQRKEAVKKHFFKQAYVDDKGVPCETLLLGGRVVQEYPSRRVSLAMA